MKPPTKLRPSQGGKFASPVVGIDLRSPTTGEPRYRCFVCGDVTINNRRYAVCAECDDQHGIRDKWAVDYGEIEARHERQRSERQAAEGLQMQGGEERASKRTPWCTSRATGEANAADAPSADCRECFCPGWLWMNEEDDASFNVERCDTCRLHGDDLEAATAMVSRCGVAAVDWS